MIFRMNGTKLSRNHNRHPGAGRDPEPLLVGSFLDSGLRQNDGKKLTGQQ